MEKSGESNGFHDDTYELHVSFIKPRYYITQKLFAGLKA